MINIRMRHSKETMIEGLGDCVTSEGWSGREKSSVEAWDIEAYNPTQTFAEGTLD